MTKRQKNKSQPMSRTTTLKLLGYASYAEYLRGMIWQGIRAKELAKHPSCYCCGEVASHVHHSSYKPQILSGDSRAGLITLCAGCHRGAHEWARENANYPPRLLHIPATRWMRQRRRDVALHEQLDDAAVQAADRAE